MGVRIGQARATQNRLGRAEDQRGQDKEEARIRALFASNPEAAIQQAESKGMVDLAVQLRAQYTGSKRTELHAASRGVTSAATGLETAARDVDLSTPTGRASARNTLSTGAANLATGASALQTRAGELRASPELTQSALLRAGELGTQIGAQVEAIDTLGREIQNLSRDIHAGPEEVDAALERIKKAYLAGERISEGSKEGDAEFRIVEAAIRRNLQSSRDRFFMESVMPYVKDPIDLRLQAINYRISAPLSPIAEGQAKALEKAEDRDVSEKENQAWRVISTMQAQSQILARSDVDSAIDLIHQAADIADRDLKLSEYATSLRKNARGTVASWAGQSKVEFLDWARKQYLMDPFLFAEEDQKVVPKWEDVVNKVDAMFPASSYATSTDRLLGGASENTIAQAADKILDGLLRADIAAREALGKKFASYVENLPESMGDDILKRLEERGWKVDSKTGGFVEIIEATEPFQRSLPPRVVGSPPPRPVPRSFLPMAR